jgi:hypothetical protein
MRFCPFCRAGVEPGQRFCVSCGSALPGPPADGADATRPLPGASPGPGPSPEEVAGPGDGGAPRRRGPWVAVAVAAAVALVGGAGGWYALQDDSGTRTSADAGRAQGAVPDTSPEAGEGGGDAGPRASAVPSPSATPEPEVTPTVVPPEPEVTPAEPEPPQQLTEGGLVDWTAVAGRRQGASVATLFHTYFTSINGRDWSTALSMYNAANPDLPPSNPDGFIEGSDTTTDSDAVIHSLAGGGGRLLAHVEFTSHQDASDSPDDTGYTCTRWSMRYTLVRTGGAWRIDGVDAADGTTPYRPC